MIKGVAKDSTSVFVGEVVFITYGEESTSDLLALIVKVVESLLIVCKPVDLFTISIIVRYHS